MGFEVSMFVGFPGLKKNPKHQRWSEGGLYMESNNVFSKLFRVFLLFIYFCIVFPSHALRANRLKARGNCFSRLAGTELKPRLLFASFSLQIYGKTSIGQNINSFFNLCKGLSLKRKNKKV